MWAHNLVLVFSGMRLNFEDNLPCLWTKGVLFSCFSLCPRHSPARKSRWAGGEDVDKLFFKVIIKPSIEQGVRTGRGHAHHVADGKNNTEFRRILDAQKVNNEITNVQGEPRDAKNNGDWQEKRICLSNPLFVPSLLLVQLSWLGCLDHAMLQLLEDPSVCLQK